MQTYFMVVEKYWLVIANKSIVTKVFNYWQKQKYFCLR